MIVFVGLIAIDLI